MISSGVWIARGVAARHPTKQKLDEAEMERISALTGTELGEAERQLAQAQAEAGGDGWEDVDEDEEAMEEDETDAHDLTRYRLDTYDEEPSQTMAMGALSGIRGAQFFRDDNDDPYMTLKDDPADEEEEREQLEARLEEEKNRADSAEDCVRNLRYTNEESRRAIMRLQSMRSSSQRSDDDGADRRRSGHILSSLSGRSDADSETDRSGLRDLRLVSPSQPSQEQFSPPMRPDEPATDDVSSQHGDDTVSTMAPAIAGFFPSSLLRSSLGFSRKGPGDEASGADLSMEEMRVEHEKTQKELRALQQEWPSLMRCACPSPLGSLGRA